eukprot:516935_1
MATFLFLVLIAIHAISGAPIDTRTIDTEYYGATGGDPLIAINQGRINSVTSWGFTYTNVKRAWTHNAIRRLSWSSDQQTINYQHLNFPPSFYIECPSFILPKSDYINGYRVIYNSKLVYGLYFYTAKKKTYECIG